MNSSISADQTNNTISKFGNSSDIPDNTASILGTVLDSNVNDASQPRVSAVIVLNLFDIYSLN